MTELEALEQQDRLIRYRDLRDVESALKEILRNLDNDVFTGNIRDSRKVKGLEIHLTPPIGGGQPAKMILVLDAGEVEANDLALFLRDKVNKRLDEIKERIKAV